jgi:hypothetical protein
MAQRKKLSRIFSGETDENEKRLWEPPTSSQAPAKLRVADVIG